MLKALIPLAGLGKRLGPLAGVIPKAMFPLIDKRQQVLPLLQFVLTQAHWAGAKEAALVVPAAQTDLIRRYLVAARKAGLNDVPENIEFVIQPAPMGFGDAGVRGANFVGDQPFMLLLGDHVYADPPDGPSCAAQVAAELPASAGRR